MLVDFSAVLLLLGKIFKMAARQDQPSRNYYMKMSKYLELYENNSVIITRTVCHEHRNAPNRFKTVGMYENTCTLKLFVKEHQFIYFLFFNESSSFERHFPLHLKPYKNN